MVEKYGAPPDHIFLSSNFSFNNGVLANIQGKGVDVSVNSLVETPRQAGLDCLAQFGRFIEVGKRDLMINSTLRITVFNRFRSHISSLCSSNIVEDFRYITP